MKLGMCDLSQSVLEVVSGNSVKLLASNLKQQ